MSSALQLSEYEAFPDVCGDRPRGIQFATVSCPRGLSSDALLIASWRADSARKPLHRHLARARRLIDGAPECFARVQVGLSDHDRAMFERLGGTADIDACLLAAWMTVGVKTVKRKPNIRSLWDHKLIERRLARDADIY